jgi:hypothetical protein
MPIDELVERAMQRWPDVPAMYGWLRLDRRGRWLLIDRGRPGFDEARDGAGSEITSPPIIDFIGRNYLADPQGRWYWQNGPQRVFVDLDIAPLVFRVLGEGERTRLVTHTGYPSGAVLGAGIDRDGNLFAQTEAGPGVIHDLDLAALEMSDSDPDSVPENDQGGSLRLRLGREWHALRPLASPPGMLGYVVRPRAAAPLSES